MKPALVLQGFLWMSNAHTTAYYWSHAGQHFEIRDEGDWCVCLATIARCVCCTMPNVHRQSASGANLSDEHIRAVQSRLTGGQQCRTTSGQKRRLSRPPSWQTLTLPRSGATAGMLLMPMCARAGVQYERRHSLRIRSAGRRSCSSVPAWTRRQSPHSWTLHCCRLMRWPSMHAPVSGIKLDLCMHSCLLQRQHVCVPA